jgi:hypothetical protein
VRVDLGEGVVVLVVVVVVRDDLIISHALSTRIASQR